jgi:predicted nucleic acid-binding protein
MARYVIDAPTLLRIVAEGVPVDPAHRLVAPVAIRSRALDLLLGAVRRGELTEAAALERHELLTGLRIRLLGDRVSRRTAWRIAGEHGWTIEEAEYVAVARLQADALVTVDAAFAARAQGLVPLAPLDVLRG